MKRLVTTLAFVVATSVSAVAQSFPLPSVGRINVLPTWTSTQHITAKLHWQLFQPRARISVSKRAH
jgi:hypothetical protein